MNVHTGPPFEGVMGSVQPDPPQPGWSERLVPAFLFVAKIYFLLALICLLLIVSLFVTDFFFGLIKTVIVYCRDRRIGLGINVIVVETGLALFMTATTIIYSYKRWGHKLWHQKLPSRPPFND